VKLTKAVALIKVCHLFPALGGYWGGAGSGAKNRNGLHSKFKKIKVLLTW
jgi:hypothetical protein